ncbi:MAG: Ni/Fe hydrogenase [Thiobacillus sp. 63-78]|uniref:hydrogenase small subunit n=1 Tax=Thiobacillus sp. 63-78 TaxID=1895859 RepID=UPI00095AC21B|nr:hydrogenase small subunit [Thiobacillus sp. 63-78]MBN8762682.1 hydrogenase small subunit [Thiobacillus sp.]MBN8774107.1 hydrogenase small subunit [Thiobacillus sp.]OJZ16945.1 MAG: Ni/Fe hydrogenase [Thiobacillus sp. 63-78]
MQGSLIDTLARQGVTRRAFLKYCATLASMMALPPAAGRAMAEAMAAAKRPSVIWLPFQECTGCTESITRSHSPTLEGMIFDMISLDYQETLMAAAGHQAEEALRHAMKENAGKYLLIVDGSIPLGQDGAYSCIGGRSNVDLLKEAAQGAAAVIAVGTCASFGGIPKANPNPTGAVSVSDLVQDKPVVNIPGCPPIPVVMTGVLAHYLTFGSLPELDDKKRPKSFFGETIHDRCYRRPFYDQGKFARTFDDEGARQGWCLFELGCKGPVTHNACATVKWNGGTSWPVESGHGCLGCSEPDFWDGGGFYKALSVPADPLKFVAASSVVGAGVGAAVGFANRASKNAARSAHETTTLADLEK